MTTGRGGVGSLALLAAIALLVAACGTTDQGSTLESRTDTSSPAGSEDQGDESASSTQPAGQEADGQDAEAPAVDLAAWAGVYVWDEFVEGDPGSDQTLIHELVLEEEADGLAGRLLQYGFQTDTEFTVVGRAIEGGIAVDIVSVDHGLTPLAAGDTAFSLTGDPAGPLTTLIDLAPLVVDRAGTGAYFRPESDSVPPPTGLDQLAGGPSTFWAIEAASYDLVEIEVATGREVRRVAGWGDVDPEGPGQALTSVEVGSGGWLWADDCCEPAAGNIFGFDPDRVAGIGGLADDDLAVQTFGLDPLVSPDGQRVAYGNYSFDVTIVDRAGALLGRVIDGGDDSTFPAPLAWLDDQTLVVADQGVDEFEVSAWDVTDPGAPAPIGTPLAVAGSARDGLRWDGDTVLVVVESDESGVEGLLIGPASSTVEPIALPADLATIDVDPSGRFLLHVGADGLARAGLLGDPIDGGTILSDVEVVAASW